MDKSQTFWIDGPLPGLNELVGAANADKGCYKYNTIKKRWQKIIGWAVKRARLWPVTSAQFSFHWIERNKRRDPDNIAAGGRKLILDALVDLEILKNDGWKQVIAWEDRFTVNKHRPGVEVRIYSE